MSYKLGFLLSISFVLMFFLLGVDLFSIQYAYGDLDAKSISISYRISQHGTLDAEFVASIENSYNVEFECLSNCSPMFGDIVEYRLSSSINTLVISNHHLTISLSRSTVIGFYS